MCTIGGMAGGATFKYVNKVFDTYTFSVSYVLLILGFVLTIAANGIVMVVIRRGHRGHVHQLDHPADHALAHEQQRGRGHHHGLAPSATSAAR